MDRSDIIIAGAGPVGLMAANLAALEGLRVTLIDRKNTFDRSTKAIGIMMPSFLLLKKTGLLDEFIRRGVQVKKAVVHGTRRILCSIEFQGVDAGFILSVPQWITEDILHQSLKKQPKVNILFETEILDAEEDKDHAVLSVKNSQGELTKITAPWCIACDGGKSLIRSKLSRGFTGGRYPDTFLMGDFKDDSGLGSEAHLFFTRKGAVESFPLPEGNRRWIVQTSRFMQTPDPGYLESEVKKRSGYILKGEDKLSESPFGVQHYIIDRYSAGRYFFAGDAAHLMSPIGGQGMNTGFADAELAVMAVKKLSGDPDQPETMHRVYDRLRRSAGLSAIRRARLSMAVGTMKGMVISLIRNLIVGLLLHTPLKNILPYHFAMLNIRYRNTSALPEKVSALFKYNNPRKTEE